MSVEIRPLVAADGSAWLGLVQALAEYERLPPPDEAAAARLLRDALGAESPIHVLYAEGDDGVACGYALYFFTYSSFLARPTLFLEDLFVPEQWRGQGIGRRLLAAVAAVARARGCGRMEWQVLRWNADALRFYERIGATTLGDWVSCRLEGTALLAL